MSIHVTQQMQEFVLTKDDFKFPFPHNTCWDLEAELNDKETYKAILELL